MSVKLHDAFRLSILLKAMENESLDSFLKSPISPSSTSDKTTSNHEDYSHHPLITYSQYHLAAIISALKLNNELFTIQNSKDIIDILPKLPSEQSFHHIPSGEEAIDSYNPNMVLTGSKETTEWNVPQTFTEDWWPSSSSTRTAAHQDNPKPPSVTTDHDTHQALSKALEPGVLEKLPYCKLYRSNSDGSEDPLYCTQVTAIFCTNPMLCCSECLTWRHAECGGHYTLSFPLSIRSDHYADFRPVCDRCHYEKDVLQKYPTAIKRLQNQRLQHLYREQITSAVMKQAALSSLTQLTLGPDSDFMGLNAAYEIACKKWNIMVDTIESDNHTLKQNDEKKENELKRLLDFLEDAGMFA
jgi:hypothetical protein